MKKLFLLVSLMFAAVSSRADVVVYTQTFSETVTGGGLTVTTNFTGYFVLDNFGTLAAVDARTLKVGRTSFKQMSDSSTTNHTSEYLDSSAAGQTLAIVGPRNIGAWMVKGKASALSLGNGNSFNAPRSFAISGFFEDGAFPFPVLLHEFKGTLTFNSTLTKAHNLAGNSIETSLSVLKTALAAKGYVPTN